MCRFCHWQVRLSQRQDHGMQTEILIYDGFDELDAIGPFEVLSPLAPRLVTLAARVAPAWA